MVRNEIKIDLTKADKAQIDNLIRILAKTKVELQGVEILAAADAMRWLSSFQAKADNKFNEPIPTQSMEEQSAPEIKKKGSKA